MPERYCFDEYDHALLGAAAVLLKKVATAETLRPAQLVSVAKLQHVLSRLPRVTPDLEVTVSVIGPRRKFGEVETWHYWDIVIEGEQLSISSGGHFYQPNTGGDSFTTMNWSAVPEEPAVFEDYRSTLGIVPDVQSFPEAVAGIDFPSGAYRIEITDPGNELLVEDEDTDEDAQIDNALMEGVAEGNEEHTASQPISAAPTGHGREKANDQPAQLPVRTSRAQGRREGDRRPQERATDRKEAERGEVVKAFSDPSTEAKYLSLGFVPEGRSLKLSVGNVSVYATEHPWKDAILVLESFSPRTMTQYDIACPTKCSAEQIAGLIYMNVATNFQDSADAFKSHFEKIGVPLFQ